ncbi:MAG: DNA polymerase III subunit delta [Capnocytophaga sp.]|nr:DNA polymerase III subunit delta [Capnocytophaga sp.]
MKELNAILANLQNKIYAPIYFLMGDEPYFIDVLSDYIAKNVLSEDEKGFNQMVLYGQDVSMSEIISNAKRYPMMASHQVIIVKEAQALKRSIDELDPYLANPTPSTILVFCYKYDTLDKRKAIYKKLAKNHIVFESKKLYDNQVAEWIPTTLKERQLSIQPKASQMLVEFLGNDLGRIQKELDKLALIVPARSEITPDIIEKNIGISKDFNNFELRKAIALKDEYKAALICRYFADNPKDNPFVVTVGVLYGFFQQLLSYHGLSDHSDSNVASHLKVHPMFVREYHAAARNFPMKKVSGIIAALRTVDMKSKGVGAVNMAQADLLKETLIHIFR